MNAGIYGVIVARVIRRDLRERLSRLARGVYKMRSPVARGHVIKPLRHIRKLLAREAPAVCHSRGPVQNRWPTSSSMTAGERLAAVN